MLPLASHAPLPLMLPLASHIALYRIAAYDPDYHTLPLASERNTLPLTLPIAYTLTACTMARR